MSERERDHQAFHRAILDQPDDDTPRLIYADWLEEQGDPRGEFIRVQCELARLSASDPNKAVRQAHAVLARRAHLLASKNQPRGRLGWLMTEYRFVVKLRRGFVESVDFRNRIIRFSEATFAELAELAPIRDLRVVVNVNRLRALLQSPLAPRLRSLRLNGSALGTEGLQLLATSPVLSELRSLSLANCGLSADSLVPLGDSKTLTKLTFLNLNANRLRPRWSMERLWARLTGPERGFDALTRSESLGNLEVLLLRNCGIDDVAARLLAESPTLKRITKIDLTWNSISPDASRAVSQRFGPAARL